MGLGRLLSSISVGAATVDTRLERDELAPGEEVRGVVEVMGGDSEQGVNGIRLEVQTHYKRKSGDSTVTETGTIERFPVSGYRTIEANSREEIPFSFRRGEIPFSFRLPYDTPLTLGRTSVWIRTALDVRMALDPSDSDLVTVRPNAAMRSVLDSMQSLGFRMREAENEELPHRLRRRLPFGQKLEFVATSGESRGRFDEVELIMFPSEGSVDLVLQIDRRARDLGSFLSEAIGADESYASLTIPHSATSGEVREALAQTIRHRA
jgi:sporulation-control protein